MYSELGYMQIMWYVLQSIFYAIYMYSTIKQKCNSFVLKKLVKSCFSSVTISKFSWAYTSTPNPHPHHPQMLTAGTGSALSLSLGRTNF